MKKSILALVIAAASTSAFATVNDASEVVYGDRNYVRVTEEGHEYGPAVVMGSSNNQGEGSYVWFSESGSIVAHTHDKDGYTANVVLNYATDTEVNNKIQNAISKVEQNVTNEITNEYNYGNVNGGIASVCQVNNAGDNGTGSCNVNIETVNGGIKVDVSNLTEEQLAELKGETGATGATGAAGKDGKDADMTIVNSNTDRITELEGKEDKVRTDAEIKAIADVGDKILGNEIDALRDETVAKNNAQDKAIKTQWDLIQDVEAKNEQQDNRLDNVETSVGQAHDRITDLQQTVYEEGVIRAESDRILGEAIETAREESAAGDAYLQAQIDTKVSQADFEADQARRDANTAYAQQTADAALSTAAQNQQWIVQLGDESRAEDARLDAKIEGVHQLSVERDEQLQKYIDVVDANSQQRDEALLAGLNSVNDASVERDKQLTADIAAGDKATLNSANKYTDDSVATAQKANQLAREEMVAEQAKVDNLQNKQIATQAKTILQNQDRLAATETSVADLYALGNERDSRIAKNSEAIKALDGRVSNLEQKVEEQGSFIAGIGAQAAIPQADLYVGETALGMGAYTDAHNNDALALQLQTMPSEKVRVNVGLSAAPEDFSNTWQASVGGVVKF